MAKESLIAMTKLLRMQEFVLSSCVSLSTPSAGYRNWERAGCPDMQRSRAFQPSQRRSGSTTPETKFDSDSGQVFTETKVRVNRKHGADWICEYKTPKLLKSHQAANGHGPRSLFQIAKSLLVRNFRSLTVDHFAATVPWEIAEKVWEEITITHAESFHAWRTLAKAYPLEFSRSKYRYKLDIRQPSLPLLDYFKGITSPPASWLTCLRISPKQISTTDLIAIAQIQNLTVLDLSDTQHITALNAEPSPFNERILRSWAELATSTKCSNLEAPKSFQDLRVLLLGWQDTVSPRWLFKYLQPIVFPRLVHIILTDCPHLHQRNREEWEQEARTHGWEARRQKRSAKSLRPILDETTANSTFYLGAVSGFCYTDHFRDGPRRTDPTLDVAVGEETETKDRLPVLECWIGTPKPWTHILDEFPGSRTVWFDRVSDAVDIHRRERPAGQSARPEWSSLSNEENVTTTTTTVGAGLVAKRCRSRDRIVERTVERGTGYLTTSLKEDRHEIELPSPPPKRTQGGLRPKPKKPEPRFKGGGGGGGGGAAKTVSGLLAEFMR